MRIGIDIRYLSHGLIGGVHAYVAHVVPALVRLAPEHHFILYADTKRALELEALPSHVVVRYLSYRSPLSSVANDLLMQLTMARDRLDVAHFPANYGFAPRGVPAVITLHDAINILPWTSIIRGHRKDPRTLAMMTYLHLCSSLALRRAQVVLTVSARAREEIAARSGFDRHRILVVPNAPAPTLRRVVEPDLLIAVRERHGLATRFILADALKNPAAVVRAWRRLPPGLRIDRQLVFYARRPAVDPIIGEAVAGGHARLLLRPTSADLAVLYSLADAFVFPSWYEGFGIPLLEAMTCGAPVVASDRGAIPEVVGDAALLTDAEDDAAIAHHLSLILTEPAVAAMLRRRGFARAAHFSWETSARQVLAGYELARREARAGPAARAQPKSGPPVLCGTQDGQPHD